MDKHAIYRFKKYGRDSAWLKPVLLLPDNYVEFETIPDRQILIVKADEVEWYKDIDELKD